MTGAEAANRPVSLASAAELEAFVASHDRALVEFHTEGCSACAAMEPVLSGVAKSTDVAVATMNPRDDPALLETYDVRSVPKLLLFEDGDLVATREDGFLGVDEVRAFLGAEEASDATDGASDATDGASDTADGTHSTSSS